LYEDHRRVDLWGESSVTVLHLHGATGWYRRPPFAPGYQPKGSGAIPIAALGAAPTETQISIDPEFLRGFGIFTTVDACLPDTIAVADQRHVVLHPSFLKDYSSEGSTLTRLWRLAAAALKNAERVFVVGYSLPKADAAAQTLLLTNCSRGVVRVINLDGGTKLRLSRLLQASDPFGGTVYFQNWAKQGCPDSIPFRPKARVAV